MLRLNCIIVWALLSSSLASAPQAQPLSEFAIYLWGTPKMSNHKDGAKALAAAGFNVVDWPAEHLDALTGSGLKAMVHRPDAKLAKSLAEHPDVWGYHLADEPYPEAKFPALAAQIRDLAKADAKHPAFINVLSTSGPFLRTYMQIVRPPILSFDYYQWWWGSNRYFEKLEQFREAALRAGVPLMSCLEATANPTSERGDTTYLPDNAAKLRQSLYTTLAYGAKGISWFSSNAAFALGSSELSPAGRDVAELNAELQPLGKVLVELRSLDVFHTPPLAAGTRTAPVEYWVQLIGEERRPGLVQGMFTDDEGVDYMLVANRDYRQSQSVVVKLQSKWLGIAPWHAAKNYSYAIEQFDRQQGTWTTVSSSSFVGFTFVIAAGDGELFKITTRIEE